MVITRSVVLMVMVLLAILMVESKVRYFARATLNKWHPFVKNLHISSTIPLHSLIVLWFYHQVLAKGTNGEEGEYHLDRV